MRAATALLERCRWGQSVSPMRFCRTAPEASAASVVGRTARRAVVGDYSAVTILGAARTRQSCHGVQQLGAVDSKRKRVASECPNLRHFERCKIFLCNIGRSNPHSNFNLISGFGSINSLSTLRNPEVDCFDSEKELVDRLQLLASSWLAPGLLLPLDEPLSSLHFQGGRQWDPLDTVELLLEVESEFGVSIPEDVASAVKTLRDVKVFLETTSIVQRTTTA